MTQHIHDYPRHAPTFISVSMGECDRIGDSCIGELEYAVLDILKRRRTTNSGGHWQPHVIDNNRRHGRFLEFQSEPDSGHSLFINSRTND